MINIGLISDTHGVLRAEALALLRGSDAIIHAGDVGKPDILTALAAIAPVTAVRGNVDNAAWAQTLPQTADLQIGGVKIFVLHIIEQLALDPATCGYHAVVFGHSHKPGCRWQDGVLYINPGSAGPRRFSLPVSIGRLSVDNRTISPKLITLTI